MPAGTFVTTGHTSGSAGAGMTACAVADGAPRLPALMAVNVPPRNARRLIMSDLPQRQSRQKFKMWPSPRITPEIGRRAPLERLPGALRRDAAAPTARGCANGRRETGAVDWTRSNRSRTLYWGTDWADTIRQRPTP